MSAPLLPDADFVAAEQREIQQEKAVNIKRIDVFWIALGSALSFLLLLILVFVVYFERTIPGAWFPKTQAQVWTSQNIILVRGTLIADRSDTQRQTFQTDDSGVTVIAVNTQFPASQYPALDFDIDFPAGSVVRLIWRNDLQPNERPYLDLQIDDDGRSRATIITGHKNWFGNISSLALAVQAQPKQIFTVRSVSAHPMGVGEVAKRLVSGWLRFSPWTGTSIAQLDDAAPSLSYFIALALALPLFPVGALLLWKRLRRRQVLTLSPACWYAGIAFFLAGWLALDARWTVQLAQQAAHTRQTFGGKTIAEKHLAAVDGALYAFTEKARAALPAEPTRIFALAPDPYLRSRIAYHLYPHNVYFDFYGAMPPNARTLRSGDYVLLFQQSGIRYDMARKKMRWSNGSELAAEIKLFEAGSALIEVR
ncbi:MAG: hypothetical protein LBS40_06935 [Burkholderiales bacterium]|nr:hypothetical protein [Burkholderiales bacterium]